MLLFVLILRWHYDRTMPIYIIYEVLNKPTPLILDEYY